MQKIDNLDPHGQGQNITAANNDDDNDDDNDDNEDQ